MSSALCCVRACNVISGIENETLRRVVMRVALFNLAYFGVEFAVAHHIGSVSLFADSVDFLEDASVNLLIAAALMWTPRNRARVGMGLAAILLIPGDRKSTRLNSSHPSISRMPSSA